MPRLDLQEREIDGSPVVVLEGDLSGQGVGDLRDMFRKWQHAEAPRVMVDMSGVQFMDTSGLAHLIETHLKFERHGGKLVLFGLQPMIADVFEVTRVTALFHVAGSPESAVAALRDHAAG
jgi:anti-sigma B factor antagonist